MNSKGARVRFDGSKRTVIEGPAAEPAGPGSVMSRRRTYLHALPFCEYDLSIARNQLEIKRLWRKGFAEIPTTLGQHLRNRRLLPGLTQAQASTQCGTIREVFERWERDEMAPPIGRWRSLIRFLGSYPFPVPHAAAEVLIIGVSPNAGACSRRDCTRAADFADRNAGAGRA